MSSHLDVLLKGSVIKTIWGGMQPYVVDFSSFDTHRVSDMFKSGQVIAIIMTVVLKLLFPVRFSFDFVTLRIYRLGAGCRRPAHG